MAEGKSVCVELPEEFSLKNISPVKMQFDALVAAKQPVAFDATSVKSVDTAGIQLLVALTLHCKNTGLSLDAGEPNARITDFASGLGVATDQLGWH